MKHLILIRHGQTETNKFNNERQLTKSGRETIQHKALELGKFVVGDIAIIHSPTLRAIQTAQILHSNFNYSALFQEELRILNANNISSAKIYLELDDYKKYSVESPVELFERFDNIMKKYSQNTIVIVSHEGTLEAFLRVQNNYSLVYKTFDQFFDYGDYAILKPINNVKI